jgi:hypothetical protein
VAAEIIEFPNRGHQDPLVTSVARLEQMVREVDRLAAEQPAEGLDQLLVVMARFGDRLVDLAHLVLDDDAKRSVQIAFTSLSDKIVATRDAFDGCDGAKDP